MYCPFVDESTVGSDDFVSGLSQAFASCGRICGTVYPWLDVSGRGRGMRVRLTGIVMGCDAAGGCRWRDGDRGCGQAVFGGGIGDSWVT